MMVSPFSRCSANSAIVESVTAAGTMTQTVRGVEIEATKSAIPVDGIAPSAARALTASGLTS